MKYTKQNAVAFSKTKYDLLEEIISRVKLWKFVFGLNNTISDEIIKILEIVFSQEILTEISSNKNLEEIIREIFIHKIDHSLAALAFYQKCFGNLKLELIRSIFVLQIIQVDLADTVSESKSLRDLKTQELFFNNLLLTTFETENNDKYYDQLNKLISKSDIENNKILIKIIKNLNQIFQENTKFQNEKELAIKKILLDWIVEYYHYIVNDHTPLKHKIQSMELLLNTYNKHKLNHKKWRDFTNEFKFLNIQTKVIYFGDSISFLSVLAVYLQFEKIRDCNYFYSILNSFRFVGFYNVLLDDLSDYNIDLKNSDQNMYYEKMDSERRIYYKNFSRKIIESYINESKLYTQTDPSFSKILLNFRRIVPDMLSLYTLKTIYSNKYKFITDKVFLWLMDQVLMYKVSIINIFKYLLKYLFFKIFNKNI